MTGKCSWYNVNSWNCYILKAVIEHYNSSFVKFVKAYGILAYIGMKAYMCIEQKEKKKEEKEEKESWIW